MEASDIQGMSDMDVVTRVEQMAAEMAAHVGWFKTLIDEPEDTNAEMMRSLDKSIEEIEEFKSDLNILRTRQQVAVSTIESAQTEAAAHANAKKEKLLAAEAREVRLDARETRQDEKDARQDEKDARQNEKDVRQSERDVRQDEKESHLEERRSQAERRAEAAEEKTQAAEEKTQAASRRADAVEEKRRAAEEKMRVVERREEVADAKMEAATNRIQAATEQEEEAKQASATAAKALEEAARQEAALAEQREADERFNIQERQDLAEQTKSLEEERAELDKKIGIADEVAGDISAEITQEREDIEKQKASQKLWEEDLEAREVSLLEPLEEKRLALDRRQAEFDEKSEQLSQHVSQRIRELGTNVEEHIRDRLRIYQDVAEATKMLEKAKGHHDTAKQYRLEADNLRGIGLESAAVAKDRSQDVSEGLDKTEKLFLKVKNLNSTVANSLSSLEQNSEAWKGFQTQSINPLMQSLAGQMKRAKSLIADVDAATMDSIEKLRSESSSASDAFTLLTKRMSAMPIRGRSPTRAATSSLNAPATGSARVPKRLVRTSFEESGRHKRSRSAGAADTLKEATFMESSDLRPTRSPRAINSPLSSGPSGLSRLGRLTIPERRSSAAAVTSPSSGQGTSPVGALSGLASGMGLTGQELVSSGQGSAQVSGQTGTTDLDPPNLASNAPEVIMLWRRLQMPNNWTIADSAEVVRIFVASTTRDGGKHNRYWPRQSMDFISKKKPGAYCLDRYMRKVSGAQLKGDEAGNDRCSWCAHDAGRLCLDVSYLGEDPGEYDPTIPDKRWRLTKRE